MVCKPLHSQQSPSNGGIHVIHAFEHANEAARLAEVVTADDIGKVSFQLDNDCFFVLSSIAPVTWLEITNKTGGDGYGDHGSLSGLEDDDHPQYLLVDGTRPMEGNLDMDGYDLLNVGEINGQQFYGPLAADPVSPAPEDGDLYFNTAIGEMMFYDGSRGKWLSIKTITIQSGRNGSTTAGVFYRAINGMVLDAGDRGIPVPTGTIVSLAITKTNGTTSTLEALANGAVVASLAHVGAGETRDDTIDADFTSGVISFRNLAAGATTQNVQIVALIRQRA